MLGVGLDWAEAFHDVALGLPGKGVIEQFRMDHGPEGVARLIARCAALEPDPAEVRVVLETRHGLLVEALVVSGGQLGDGERCLTYTATPSSHPVAVMTLSAIRAGETTPTRTGQSVMTTTAPDPMQQVHPHQYPAAQTPTPNQPLPRRRWPWVLGIALAFFVGVGVGGAGDTSDTSDTSDTAGGAPVAGDSLGIPDGVPLGMPEPVAPVAPVEAPPPAAPEPPPGPATTIGEGVYVVGEDIEPGTYKTAGPSDPGTFGMCYWARLSDTSGDFDSIIANGSPQGPGTVTISPSDGAFDTSGCELWTKGG